jgi:hypothetical protein
MFKIRAVHKEKIEELTKSATQSEDSEDSENNVDDVYNVDDEKQTTDISSLSLSLSSSSSSKNKGDGRTLVINSKTIPSNTVRGTSSSNMIRPSNFEGGYETDLY